MKNCIASMPSLNISIQAQRALGGKGIFSRIVSLDPSMTKKGCAYGIEFSCEMERDVKAVLKRERIYPSEFISEAFGKPL